MQGKPELVWIGEFNNSNPKAVDTSQEEESVATLSAHQSVTIGLQSRSDSYAKKYHRVTYAGTRSARACCLHRTSRALGQTLRTFKHTPIPQAIESHIMSLLKTITTHFIFHTVGSCIFWSFWDCVVLEVIEIHVVLIIQCCLCGFRLYSLS